MSTQANPVVSNNRAANGTDYKVKARSTTEGIVQAIDVESGLSIPQYDYVGVAYPTGTQEVYTFKTGGSGGTTVTTITIDYTDSTKANISAVTKT